MCQPCQRILVTEDQWLEMLAKHGLGDPTSHLKDRVRLVRIIFEEGSPNRGVSTNEPVESVVDDTSSNEVMEEEVMHDTAVMHHLMHGEEKLQMLREVITAIWRESSRVLQTDTIIHLTAISKCDSIIKLYDTDVYISPGDCLLSFFFRAVQKEFEMKVRRRRM